MLAEVISVINSASWAQPSPRSQLRSISIRVIKANSATTVNGSVIRSPPVGYWHSGSKYGKECDSVENHVWWSNRRRSIRLGVRAGARLALRGLVSFGQQGGGWAA